MSTGNSSTTKRSGKVAASKKTTTQQSALDHALAYAAMGIPVIWIPPRSKAPKETGWPSLATTDPDTIKRWAVEHRNSWGKQECNFGLAMGHGFVALDVDDPSKLPELKQKGFDLPQTRVHKSSRGFHFIYRVPEGVTFPNGKFFNMGEVRSMGGQVVCPGSTHPDGPVYQIDDDSPIADLPEVSLKMLMTPEPSKSTAQASTPNGGKKIEKGEGRRDFLFRRACLLRAHGDTEEVGRAKLIELDKKSCDPPLFEDEPKVFEYMVHDVWKRYEANDAVQAILASERPVVLLPSDDRLMSDCAAELGGHLANELYLFNGEVVTLAGSTPQRVSPQSFRTMVENFAVCAKQKMVKKNSLSIDIHVTMTVDVATGILASEQFREKLRPLKRIATCRLPVIRNSGAIELLPEGYDPETATMTVSDVVYQDDMAFEDGVTIIRDLYSEFEFADGERSLSVAVTALVGLFATQLVDVRALRPAYAFTKNATGAGATLLAKCAVVPVLGFMPSGVKPKDDDEMRKRITATLRDGRSILLLDNVKGRLDLPSLEALTTAFIWDDRLLGTHETIIGENSITTFITGNGMTVTPDLRRRTLWVELHMSAELPENRKFKRALDENVLIEMRPRILAACWAVVRHWNEQGRSQASRTHSFPSWDRVMGGIVESAGFGCPFAPAPAAAVADEDGDSMRSLVAAMTLGTEYKASDLIRLCCQLEVFAGLVSMVMERTHKAKFGFILKGWDNRQCGDRKLIITGKEHSRRFKVVGANAHGCMVEHGVSPQAQKSEKVALGSNTMSDHATMSPPQRRPRARRTTSHGMKEPPKFTRAGWSAARNK